MDREEDDGIYSGFQQRPTYGPASFLTGPGGMPAGVAAGGVGAQKPPSTAAQIPRTGMRQPGATPGGIFGASGPVAGAGIGTASGATGTGGEPARPMTSNRGAGFSSAAPPGSSAGAASAAFDPLRAARPPPPPLKMKADTPEAVAAELELAVNRLLEESAILATNKDYSGALERAKEAGKKERQLARHREVSRLADQTNIDLTYAVIFNLAVQYENTVQYTEALNTYSLLVKNKQYAQSPRLRINMGNIYYKQRKYPQAIKMYRMALDQVPSSNKGLRYRILRNIGNTCVRMGQFQDAIQSFESILDQLPDVQTGMNLLLCYYALADKEKMKRCFLRLLAVPVPKAGAPLAGMLDMDPLRGHDPQQQSPEPHHAMLRVAEAPGVDGDDDADDPHAHLITDELRDEIRQRERVVVQHVLRAGRLIAPAINDWTFVIDAVSSWELNQRYHCVQELEMSRAMDCLRRGQFREAVDSFKAFEKKDDTYRTRAATNLSYLYFLEGDHSSAKKYAQIACDTDKYNAKALVNRANCMFQAGEFEEARQSYLDAIEAEADCVEAIFNYALSCKRQEKLPEALRAFKKLHTLVPESIEVMWQCADLHERLDEDAKAIELLNKVVSRVPTDSGALAHLGALLNKTGDESQAFHFYQESYRYLPCNMDVISWLGAYFVKSEMYEKAKAYFERAAEVQPREVKWKLMVASCLRRMSNFQQALQMYRLIHEQHPDNVECVRYLAHICHDLGMAEDAVEYHKQLVALEARLREQQQQQQQQLLLLLQQQQQQVQMQVPVQMHSAGESSGLEFGGGGDGSASHGSGDQSPQQSVGRGAGSGAASRGSNTVKRPPTASGARKAAGPPSKSTKEDESFDAGDDLLHF